MISADDHSRTKWMQRGDPSKSIHEGWRNGIKVECPNYQYEEARLDPDAKAIILKWGDELRTVIDVFTTTNYYLKIPVVCVECGSHHNNPSECPSCGSWKWMCR